MDEITKKRFKEMRGMKSIFEEELKIFDEILKKYQISDNDSLQDYCYGIYKRRIEDKKGVSVRAYFAVKIFDYFKFYIKEDLDYYSILIDKIAFIMESVILIQYLDNQILDGKFGVTSSKKINKNLITSNILKELLFLYIENTCDDCEGDEFPPDRKREIKYMLTAKVRDIFLKTDLGQRIEKEYSTYEVYKNKEFIKLDGELANEISSYLKSVNPVIDELKKELKKEENKPFIDLYFNRTFLTNSNLFVGTVEIIGEVLGVKNTAYYKNMVNFSVAYSMVLQVVNDVADFAFDAKSDLDGNSMIETTGKNKDDYLSDLANNNLTLLLIIHLDKSRRKRVVEQYLENDKEKKALEKIKEQITHELIYSGAIMTSIEIGKSFKEIGIKELDEKNPISTTFESMIKMGEDNKYYKTIKKFYHKKNSN